MIGGTVFIASISLLYRKLLITYGASHPKHTVNDHFITRANLTNFFCPVINKVRKEGVFISHCGTSVFSLLSSLPHKS